MEIIFGCYYGVSADFAPVFNDELVFFAVFWKNYKKISLKSERYYQCGCAPCTMFELLKAHRLEVIAIKEQIRYVRERLAI